METQRKYSVANIVLLISSIILTGLNLFAYFFLFDISEWLKICLIVASFLLVIISIIAFALRRFALFKTCFVTIVIIALFTWIYQLIIFLGYGELFESADAMQEFIASTGAWGMVVFCIIQFLQVVLIPIPAVVTTVAGVYLFGPTVTMFLSLFSIIIASYVAFFIGRFLGEKVVSWLIGKESCHKYSKLLYDKGKYLFFLMMLFPFFPDDILCMVAGMTTMRLSFFTWTMFIARPVAIIPMCYLAGGEIIPFSGWGLIVWGILIIIMLVLFVLSYKHQAKIESFIIRLSERITKKKGNKLQLQKIDNETISEEINIDTAIESNSEESSSMTKKQKSKTNRKKIKK